MGYPIFRFLFYEKFFSQIFSKMFGRLLRCATEDLFKGLRYPV